MFWLKMAFRSNCGEKKLEFSHQKSALTIIFLKFLRKLVLAEFFKYELLKQDWKAFQPSRWREKLTRQTITIRFMTKTWKFLTCVTLKWLADNLNMTCSKLGRDMHKTQHDLDIYAWLHHDLSKTCKWLGIDTELMNVTEIKPIDIILPLKVEKYYDNDKKDDT